MGKSSEGIKMIKHSMTKKILNTKEEKEYSIEVVVQILFQFPYLLAAWIWISSSIAVSFFIGKVAIMK